MPRFNFASDPKNEQDTPKKKPAQPEDTSGKSPMSGTEPESPGQGRRIPLDEAIPPAYRELPKQDFTPKTESGIPSSSPEPEPTEPQSTKDQYVEPEEPASSLPFVDQESPAPELPVFDDEFDFEENETKAEAREDELPDSPSQEPVAEPVAETEPETPPAPMPSEEEDDFDNPFSGLEHDEYLTEPIPEPAQDAKNKRSLLPLFGIGGIVGSLILLSVVWFLNPYPPLRETLKGFFFGTAPSQPSPSATQPESDESITAIADSLDEDVILERDWNYYLQISAFKELYTAQDDANRLRKMGLNAKVEGEYIPSQRRTYYRVRLGPFESAYAAALKGDSLKDVIPSSAFIDSIRVETDAVTATDSAMPIVQPVLKKSSRASSQRTQRTAAQTQQKPARETPVGEAASGYAVHVSSFTTLATAQEESRSLITRGLPAYTSKSVQNGTTWYRVLVGPFRTRAEAERYLEIINKESGASAYVRSLGK